MPYNACDREGTVLARRFYHAAMRVMLACALVFGGLALSPNALDEAWADNEESQDASGGASTGPTATEIDAEPDEFQQKVEQTAAAYDEATARVSELEAQIAENETRIAEIEQDIPEQQTRTAAAMRVLYKTQNDVMGMVNMVLGAGSLNDFLSAAKGLSYIYESNVAEVERLSAAYDELDSTRQALSDAKQEADEQQAVAQQALEEAQAAREEAQRRAQEQAEREAAEAAAAAEAEALAQEQAAASEAAEANGQDESTTESTVSVEAPSSDGADWSSDKSAFVAEWAPRIDAYLAGSPLAGQGTTFAEAAWTYGVDPRWSPAISNTESSKGRHCFASHNAWGWGSSSWSSWEEAINAHVAGLARGYGYTISVTAAKKYCPPNWQNWYNNTLAEMNKI